MSGNLKNRFLRLLALLLLMGAAATQPARAAESGGLGAYSEYDPSPIGVLHISRPSIEWRLAPQSGSRVTRVRMFINGVPVGATYDPDPQSVSYVPRQSLRPGSYVVDCSVRLDSRYDVSRSWSFSITQNAVESTAAPSATQSTICDAINAIRAHLNLPPVAVDARLCAAADGHTTYLGINRTVGHDQDPRLPGFSGAGAAERAVAFGYSSGCYETVSQGAEGAAAVSRMFDGPYHRLPFLQPGKCDVGAGASSDIVTLLFGVSSASGVVSYPANGQRDVPTAWLPVESPNPLRHYRACAADGSAGPATGYPITIFNYGPGDRRLTQVKATVTVAASAAPVDVYVNTPDDDEFLHNGIVIIPKSPLKAGETYRVAFQAMDESRATVARTFTFTTAAPERARATVATSANGKARKSALVRS